MRTLALLLLVGCATAAQAQPPKTYTPATPPRPGEETILNARVVSVDRAGSRLTVRGVDLKADGGSNETFTVAAPASSRLAELKPGQEVLLTLRGTTIVDLKVSVTSGGEAGNVIRGTTGTYTLQGSPAPARSPAPAVTPLPGAVVVAPPPIIVVSPQPVTAPPVPGAVPATAVVPGVVYVAPPSPVPQGTPFPTPRPVATPVPVGAPPVVPTPVPVLVPADTPPSPATSPATSPTPSPQAP